MNRRLPRPPVFLCVRSYFPFVSSAVETPCGLALPRYLSRLYSPRTATRPLIAPRRDPARPCAMPARFRGRGDARGDRGVRAPVQAVRASRCDDDGVETRTSSPVRFARGEDFQRLYTAQGEGGEGGGSGVILRSPFGWPAGRPLRINGPSGSDGEGVVAAGGGGGLLPVGHAGCHLTMAPPQENFPVGSDGGAHMA